VLDVLLMRDLPRILTIMGSGETTSSMAPVHRVVLGRLGGPPVRATLLDTPYGFQENASDITAAAVDYFATRLRNPISVASIRGREADPIGRQAALARIRDADYVFSGPGSPSYALRHWIGTEVPGLLAEKLTTGGALVTASAAALTLGRLTVPVYEVYKVGEDVHWLAGLDLLSAFGLPVAVIPHYDNAEGRGHDTRFCFLGDRRLRRLEAEMPEETFILGVDEHTSLMLDLGTGRATIRGRGGVTVRRAAQSVVFPAGVDVTIGDFRSAAFGARQRAWTGGEPTAGSDDDVASVPGSRIAECEGAFDAALVRLDIAAAARSLLAVDDLITEGGSAESAARRSLHAMVGRLAGASVAVTERAELVDPLTDALVEVRRTARARGDWAAADAIRDRLRALGLELQDSDEATTWSLRKE
jgi:cyanophycinase-like exopeptidase